MLDFQEMPEFDVEDEAIENGYRYDPKTNLFLVYVNGEIRAAGKDQIEAAYLYEKVR